MLKDKKINRGKIETHNQNDTQIERAKEIDCETETERIAAREIGKWIHREYKVVFTFTHLCRGKDYE